MKFFKFLPLCLVGLLFNSCSSDDDGNQYMGEETLTVMQSGDVAVVEGDSHEFVYDVVLSKSFNTEVYLTFKLDNETQNKGLLEVENPVVIPKNTTKGKLKIIAKGKPDAENFLQENASFHLVLESVKGIPNEIKLEREYSITVKPEEGFTPLTEAQQELLAAYKKKGVDLTPWIGKIPVTVNVKSTGDGTFEPFASAYNKNYEGVTYITLSEKATKEKPVLKMVKNAFGLNDYFQYVFRHETILNTDYWNNENVPSPKKVLQYMGEERVNKWKNKEYSFNVVVDDLVIEDNQIKFIYENGTPSRGTNFTADNIEKDTSAIDFVYEFPLWDEMLAESKNNADLKEALQTGGSIYPGSYIGGATALTDDWEDGSWVAPTSTINPAEGIVRFTFNTDYADAGTYDVVTVTYTSPFKK